MSDEGKVMPNIAAGPAYEWERVFTLRNRNEVVAFAGRSPAGARQALYQAGISVSFDWSEYLRLAQQLTQSTAVNWDREAASRCAISRAYYAAFCAARNHLEREGQRLSRTARDHRDYDDTLVGLGGTLENLEEAAEEALRMAEEALRGLAAL